MFRGVLRVAVAAVAIGGVCKALASSETKEFMAKELVRLELTNQGGRIRIIGEATDKIIVKVDKVNFGEKCLLSFKQTDKVLEIDSGKRSMLSNVDCEANFSLVIPKKMKIQLKNLKGPVDIAGTKGELEIKVGAGDVKVQSIVDHLNAIAGKGSFDIQGMVGSANIKLGSGDIKLGYSKDPGKGEVDIKTGSGDATLFLPAKMRVHSRVLVGSGDAFNELGDFEDAKFFVSFKAGSGNLNIKASSHRSIE